MSMEFIKYVAINTENLYSEGFTTLKGVSDYIGISSKWLRYLLGSGYGCRYGDYIVVSNVRINKCNKGFAIRNVNF